MSRYEIRNGQLEVKGYADLWEDGLPSDPFICPECGRKMTRAKALEESGDLQCPDCECALISPEEDESDDAK